MSGYRSEFTLRPADAVRNNLDSERLPPQIDEVVPHGLGDAAFSCLFEKKGRAVQGCRQQASGLIQLAPGFHNIRELVPAFMRRGKTLKHLLTLVNMSGRSATCVCRQDASAKCQGCEAVSILLSLETAFAVDGFGIGGIGVDRPQQQLARLATA